MTGNSLGDIARTGLALAIVLILSISAIPAQGTRAEVALVFGKVSDNQTKNPIDGAYVMIKGNGSFVMTDKLGDYAIPGVLYGSYELWAYMKGYEPAKVILTVDEQAETFDFLLEPEQAPPNGMIKGSVTTEAGTIQKEIDKASVIFSSLDLPGAEDVSVDVEGEGDTGDYWASLPPGDYSLVCIAPMHHPVTVSPVTVISGKVTYVDFQLSAIKTDLTTLRGHVKEIEIDVFIPNATVIAYNEDDGTQMETQSDIYGMYIFNQVENGNYTVVALKEGYEPGSVEVQVIIDRHKSDADIALKPGSSALLWGFVFGDGIPLDHGWVFTEDLLWTRSNLFGIPGLYALYPYPSAVTSTATAWATRYHFENVIITGTGGAMKRQDFHLKYSGGNNESSAVFFRVMKEPDMVPLEGASISFYRIDAFTGLSSFSATKDLPPDQNTWMTYPVPVADGYSMKCTRSGFLLGHYYDPILDKVLDVSSTRLFNVTPGAPLLLELRMNGSAVLAGMMNVIWGYVTLDMLGGFPVIGADVPITPYDGEYCHIDASGMYEYRVAPGTYYVWAIHPGAFNICPYDVDNGWWGIGEYPVVVDEGETRHIDFVMSVRSEAHSTIAGQVLDNRTLAPVRNFELMASSSEVTMGYHMTSYSGFFMFSPISDTDTSWNLIGGYSLHHVVRSEYRTMPSGAWTPSTDWPLSFDVPASSLIYVKIYIDPVGPNDLNNSVIWGYVHQDTETGPLLEGAYMTLWPYSGTFHYSNADGFFSYEVPYGDHLMQSVYPGMNYMLSIDRATGTWGIGLWVGTLLPGESRHVDVIIVMRSMNTSTIAGRVLDESDGSVVDGYRIKAYTDTVVLPVTTTLHGFFTFTPLTAVGAPWSLIGDSGTHPFVKAVARILPSGSEMVDYSYPATFSVGVGQTLWVDIYVNGTAVSGKGTIEGRVLEMYSYRPVANRAVYAVPVMDLGTEAHEAQTGADGSFQFELYPGEYKIRTKGPEIDIAPVQQELTVMVRPGEAIKATLYVPPSGMVPALATKIKFVEGKVAVEKVKVQIAGIGEFTSDSAGIVSFLLAYKANYTLTISRDVLSIRDSAGTVVAFNSDGTMPMVPGETYTISLKETRSITRTKSAGIEDPLSIGLLAAAIIALIVGLAMGSIMAKRKKGLSEE